ncbi:glycoside hydrolase family 5 protein [Canariomyces notabilis]|uniref:glucan 1,3-beta-glucosidase n=1 Tax=Canariomyces notabilis TaxID=2074819 RepID=A0AAN6TBG6_9PEZI|nr:glycoside hydrolase family 5 protein [Canariomyces arenarius]
MPRDPSAARHSRDRERERERRHRRHSVSQGAGGEAGREEDGDDYRLERRTKRRRRPSTSAPPGRDRDHHARAASASEGGSGSAGGSHVLSTAALARLNQANASAKPRSGEGGGGDGARNERRRDRERDRTRKREREMERERERERELLVAARRQRDRERERDRSRGYERVRGLPEWNEAEDGYRIYRDREREKRKSKRVVSGAVLEEGRGGGGKGWRGLRGGAGGSSDDSLMREKGGLYAGKKLPWYKQKKKLWILIGVCVVLLIIIIIVAAVVVPQTGQSNNDAAEDSKSGFSGIAPGSIPADAPSWLNPFVWQDTTDFNLTYTDETVGDLPVMGLNISWEDSAKANEHVPALSEPWGDYAKRPARGVNVGGWLSIEPFITPSLFEYDSRMGIVDEYTLCKYLGPRCESTLEKHYATFVTEDTFREIADAGLDHVRIPFSYWAVQTYDGDPYLFRTSWRYLLRAIEWCRRYGLRVNLDVHGLPGSQNGWNHSGRLGTIGWFNGTDGATNAKRSLEIHDRLSKFFAQPRYKNIITHYGLANEPRMTYLSVQDVNGWTEQAYNLVRKNGVSDAIVVFGDGFRGLDNWQGELTNLDRAALDVHQYVIFNINQIAYNHSEKVRYACEGWTEQTLQSMNRATGFGPTLVAEWSQADTDCAKHLTNVGWGNRWTGTLLTGDPSTDMTTPRCPTMDNRCSCDQANAPASQWSGPYKTFLRMFAEAQMSSFEKGWGWFYWVWDTEDA